MSFNIKEKLLEKYQGKGVVLAGDGRCDSPGSSAKFCTYSLLDIDCNKILHVESVDKREVSLQSSNMEREAVSRGISYLQAKNIKIEEIITDASSAVRKMLHKLHMYEVFTYVHTTHTLPSKYIHMHTCTLLRIYISIHISCTQYIYTVIMFL